jgi:positive regulator of sigma E activity
VAAELSRACTANGVVTAFTAGRVQVDLEPPPRCAGCNGACLWYASSESRSLSLPTRDPFAVGTPGTVRVGDRELLRSAAIVYGVPLAGVLGGALLGFALSATDLGTAAGGAAALAVALAVARGLRSRLERAARNAFSVVPAHWKRQ